MVNTNFLYPYNSLYLFASPCTHFFRASRKREILSRDERHHFLQNETTDVSPSESIDGRRRRGPAAVGQDATAQYKGSPCAAGGTAENAERPPSPRRSRSGTRYGQPTPCGRSCCPRGPETAPQQPPRMSCSCSPCSVRMLSSLSISSCITSLQAPMHSTRSLCPIFVIQTPEYQMGPAADS